MPILLEDVAQQVRLLSDGVTTILGTVSSDGTIIAAPVEELLAQWSGGGALAVTTGTVRAPIPAALTITRILVTLGTPPITEAAINVNITGTSVFTAGFMTIGAGANSATGIPDLANAVDTDYLTADITEADGADIVIAVYGIRT